MKKILVIEDNNLIRETVLELLESRGFEAVGAENGRVGIQLAIAEIPDLILSDVMMPELNGLEVFAALRSYPATASIPFIFMTATEMEKVLELKADGYLSKPCSVTEILRAIATQLEKPTISNPKYQKVTDNSPPSNLSKRAREQKSQFEIASLCSQ
ncbi:response regulator [Microcoleus sp. A006_D1]|uniref:response regulator transcription factor n=1 Tax=Microcoleus sp. A006_D1 TaxID=3055267 RepID=UPI002FD08051